LVLWFGRPPLLTLFPYTTLFRSHSLEGISTDCPLNAEGGPGMNEMPDVGFAGTSGMSDPLAERNAEDGGDRSHLRGRLNLLGWRSEEHTSELQSRFDLVCRLLLE